MSLTTYIQETRAEFKHVKWLTRNQVVNYTILVIAVSVTVALFLSLCDLAFIKLLGLLLVK